MKAALDVPIKYDSALYPEVNTPFYDLHVDNDVTTVVLAFWVHFLEARIIVLVRGLNFCRNLIHLTFLLSPIVQLQLRTMPQFPSLLMSLTLSCDSSSDSIDLGVFVPMFE